MSAPVATPTRSHLLELRRQLAFALEGLELLDQKRQTLALELVRRAVRLRAAEEEAARRLEVARAALRSASLDAGTAALDRVAVGVPPEHEVSLSAQRLLGIRLPSVTLAAAAPGAAFGFVGTSPAADLARRSFAEVLPGLAVLATLQTAVLRLGRELRKAQRRCNALTRILIPERRRAIHDIAATLEEREREFITSRRNARRTSWSSSR